MTVDPAHPAGANAAVPWILRLGVAACFVGHGALGLSRTAAWTPYFAVVGISPEHALALMPWIGALDVMLAGLVLCRPARGVTLYLVGWTLWTALLRPLAGESIWEAVERAGNFGPPFALYLFFADADGLKGWLSRRLCVPRDEALLPGIGWVLRVTTVLLLLGHGALNLIVQKPMFGAQYALLGLPGAEAEPLIGGVECLLALTVLLRPTRWLLLGILAWKVATEALCPLAGAPLWVFVEHGGSYAAPLALAVLLRRTSPAQAATAPLPAH